LYTLPSYLWTPQRRGIEETIALLEAGKDVCLYGPTGSGKTVQAVELFNWAMSKYWAGCFYLNRRLLIPQTAQKFSDARLPYGIRAADYEDLYDFSAPFQICSADTERSRVYERKIWPLHDAQLIIVDEAHLQKTGAMAQILKDYRARGARVVLLTATPIGLSRWADELVISGKMQEYRDCKALVPAIVRSIEQPDMSKVKRNPTGEYVLDGERRRIYTQTIVCSVIDRWKRYNPDARLTMAYWPGVAESVWGTEQFRKIGVNWCHVDATDAVVDGKRAKLTRSLWDEIMERCKKGDIKGISSRFKCLDSKTRILSQRGWVGMNDIQDGEVVASFDETNGSVVWAPIKGIVRRPVGPQEGMYRIKGPNMDVRVSGTHSMLYKFARSAKSWKRMDAQDLAKKKGNYVVPVSGMWDAPGVPLTDAQLSFLGWFITDGHHRKDTGGVVISQSLVQPNYIHQHIVDALTGCGVKWTSGQYKVAGYSDFKTYCVSKKELERVGLYPYIDKQMAPQLLSMTRCQLEVFLKAANLGNGCKRKNPSWNVQTMEICAGNRTFAERLQAVCVTRGMKCNVHTHSEFVHVLYITPRRTAVDIRGTSREADERPGMKRMRLEPCDHEPGEMVWCVETELGTIITERNGKVAVLGNCREGIDLPSAYHCLIATPIGSLASFLQLAGRVLRYSPETPDHVLITDHGGAYWLHGSPNHDRPWKDWWSLPEHVVSSLHQQSIKERKEPEPIRCPKCEGERKGGIKCPHCGFEHQKSQRHVIMEDGSMVVREGHLVRPKFTQCKPDTQREWTAMYKGFFNSPKAREKTFAQMEAFFYHKYKYCPPRTLNFMPIDPVDWHRKIRNVPLERLTGAKNV
jgi:superfamily II DNA or RNA helicase